MKVRSKIFMFISFSAIVVLAALLLFVYANQKRTANLQKYDIAKKISDSSFNLNLLTYDYILNKTDRAATQWNLTYENLGSLLNSDVFHSVDDIAIENVINKEYGYIHNYFNQIVSYNEANEASDRYLASESSQITIKSLLRSTTTINTYAKKLINRAQGNVNDLNVFESRLKFTLISISFILLILNSLVVYRSFYNPLVDIIRNARVIASGSLDRQIQVYSNDEMGELANEFDHMRIQLQKSYLELIDQNNNAKREAERYRTLMQTSMDGIHIIDANGYLVEYNEAFLNMLGYSDDEAHLLHVSDWEANFDTLEITARINELFESGSLFETRHKRKDGTVIDVAINATGITLDGKPHLYCSARDITYQKTAEQSRLRQMELERSNAELEQFAYVASHDLQEPLRMVASYTQLLQRRYSDIVDEKGKEYIYYAVDGAKRMQQLINDLLAFSRLTSKAQPFDKVDLNMLLNKVKVNLQIAIEDADASIITSVLPVVFGDESQLTQLFQNLINNAIKFHGDPSPVVNIKAQELTDFWQLSVSDNGIGIDEKYQEKIFVIFQRLHSKDKYDGTGIGLAVCKKVVDRHGGQIWIDSELGKGSTFYFTIAK